MSMVLEPGATFEEAQALAEKIASLSPAERASGILEHFLRYFAGYKKAFSCYFVVEDEVHQQVWAELQDQLVGVGNLAIAHGIESKLKPSDMPQAVDDALLQMGDVTLTQRIDYGADDKPFGIYLEANREPAAEDIVRPHLEKSAARAGQLILVAAV